MTKSFNERMRRLEALEQAQQPEAPAFLCVRADDLARLDEPEALSRYGLESIDQLPVKVYVGVCTCSWDDPPGCCPVCEESGV